MKNVFYFEGLKHTKHVTLSGITMKTCNDDHISSFPNVFLMDQFFISDHFFTSKRSFVIRGVNC